jgi:hypothetical protein
MTEIKGNTKNFFIIQSLFLESMGLESTLSLSGSSFAK